MSLVQDETSTRAAAQAIFGEDEIAGVRAHPRFGEAVRTAAAGYLRAYDGHRLANLVANDRGRTFVAAMVLHLHFGAEEGGPELTLEAVKTMAQREGVSSPRRTTALIALMQWAGYVAAEAVDGGVRRLAPTERLVALNRERWAAQLQGLGLIFPEALEVRRRLGEPKVLRAFGRTQGELFLSGFRPRAYAPQIALFAERKAGLVILFSLLLAGAASGEPPLSLKGLARRFHVSRPHVTRLFQDAARLGLFTSVDPAGGEAVIAPVLRDAIERWFAAVFLMNAGCARQALEGARPARPASAA